MRGEDWCSWWLELEAKCLAMEEGVNLRMFTQ